MSIRKQMFLTSAASLALGVLFIVVINVASIQMGLPLLFFVVVIGLCFLISWATFLGAFRYRPNAGQVVDDFLTNILLAIFH